MALPDMALPDELRSHHTVWVDVPGGGTAALRYVIEGDRLICRGDDRLARVAAGTTLVASLRGLASAPRERYCRVSVREVDGQELGLGALADLLGRPLGSTSAEGKANLKPLHASRRLVALEG